MPRLPRRAMRPFRVIRRTDRLAERQDVAASLTLLGKCPVHPASVELTLWGSDLTGTVTITGTLDGNVVSETLTATGPVARDRLTLVACELWDCVNTVVTADLADEAPLPQVQLRYVGEGGEAVQANCELSDCVHGYLQESGADRWANRTAGSTAVSRRWLAVDQWLEFSPRRGDIWIEDDGTQWEVEGRPNDLGSLRPHHWELRVVERAAADVRVIPAA